MNKRKKALGIIFFTVFIDLVGFGILIPIIPLLLADPNSSEYLLPRNLSVKQGYILLGLLVAVFSLGQFLAAPVLGQLSDIYGRKKIMAISIFGTAVSYVLFAIGIIEHNLLLLFISRAVDGVTAGNLAAAQAAIADITKPKDRTKNFGYLATALGLGFIFGPFIGGKLSDPTFVDWFNAATPFWFAAILSFLNVVSIILFLPETLENRKSGFKIDLTESVKNISKAFGYKKLKNLFLTTFLHQSGFAFYMTFFAVFLINRFGFSQGEIGNYFAFVGVWGIITQGFIVGKAARYYKEQKILRFSLFNIGFLMLAYLFIHDWRWIILIAPFFAVFNGLSMTNLLGLTSKNANASIQGEVMGISASLQALGRTIPPILAGFIAAETFPEAPLAVAAGIIIFAGIIFVISLNKSENNICNSGEN